MHNGKFRYYLLFPAVWTRNVSLPKPEGFAWRLGERGHRLSELLFEIHPRAHFLSSVMVNDPDLIFATVVVRRQFLFRAVEYLSGIWEP
jgi:hypothetical protein